MHDGMSEEADNIANLLAFLSMQNVVMFYGHTMLANNNGKKTLSQNHCIVSLQPSSCHMDFCLCSQ
eukprot:scaffold193213_cov36-Prasinocladus_malaysianus.AAC.1